MHKRRTKVDYVIIVGFLVGCLSFTSCNKAIEETGKEPGQMLIEVVDFQNILDSAALTGTILIYDYHIYYNSYFCCVYLHG